MIDWSAGFLRRCDLTEQTVAEVELTVQRIAPLDLERRIAPHRNNGDIGLRGRSDDWDHPAHTHGDGDPALSAEINRPRKHRVKSLRLSMVVLIDRHEH